MWYNFEIFAAISLVFWLAGSIWAVFGRTRRDSIIFRSLIMAGTVMLAVFVGKLWITIERPPLRTLGETRLWYSLFLSVIGLVIYQVWRYRWLLVYAVGLAIVFLLINFLKPDTHAKALMPALQSYWFVPHVVVYMIAYAFMGVSSLVGIFAVYRWHKGQPNGDTMILGDNIVAVGFGFLTLGLTFGALWAKEAWGNYWTWDPKEVWAFLSWLTYLGYIHWRYHKPKNIAQQQYYLALAFIVLLGCWYGLNYLPISAYSVHTYTK